MGNSQSNQPKGDQAVSSNTLYNPQTGQTTDLNSGKIYTSKIGVNPQQEQAIVGTVINCPVGQTLTAVCTSEPRNILHSNVKQGFESFESVAFNDFIKANPTLSIVLFIILFFIIAFFVFFARSASLASLS
jgi:hypothetical protein